MRNLNLLILGYIELTIKPGDLGTIVSICLRNGLQMTIKCNTKVIVLYKYKNLIINELAKNNICYEITKEHRIFGDPSKRKNRIAIIISLFLTLSLVFYISNLIWYIDIQGNDTVCDAAIMSKLEKCGLKIGQPWSRIDYGKTEIQLLNECDNIAWISVNRRGSVAYISIIESDNAELSPNENVKYSNIVASEDCVIEEIDVYVGTPVVKVGDIVKKGDVLILGMSNNEKGSTFCFAKGKVTGRVNKKISVNVDRIQYKEKIDKMIFSSLEIKIFDFSVNIFKKYRNFDEKCDIIEEKERISIFGKRKLPIEIVRKYKVVSFEEGYEASDEELLQKASFQMRAVMHNMLHDVYLNSLKTYGEFIDGGYIMSSEVVYSCDVVKDVEFFLEEN